MKGMELGLYTFADLTPDPATGVSISATERLAEVVEEAVLADQLGLDIFGVGEHHRPDFILSAPAVALAAIAARTKSIRLTSAVTVLSSDDPVRVFQDFATLDLISGGRAEIMAGRGSFIESFPLFGFDLDDYDDLFAEKLALLLKLRDAERITWSGKYRPVLKNLGVYPRPHQVSIPIWLAAGGNPGSAVRAGTLGLPMALAIIGGMPEKFAPFVQLFREAAAEAGNPTPPVSINSIGYLADTTQQAAEEFYPTYQRAMTRIGQERGWPPMSRPQFDAVRSERGALVLGSPAEVTDKILFEHSLFGHQRFMIQMSVGTLPHAAMMHAIELFGTKVAPAVRKATAHPVS